MTPRAGPGELTIGAVAVLVVSGYALARAGRTGVGLATVVGMFMLVVFIIGVAWPIITMRSLDIAVSAPVDATAGDVIEIELVIRGPRAVLIRVLDPAGEWRRAGRGPGRIEHTAAWRGVFGHVRIEAVASAPLGLFTRRRVLTVALAQPVLVGPRPSRRSWRPFFAPDHVGVPGSVPRADLTDVVRSVRPYAPGDPARAVHWPTTARRAELVVREMEPPVARGVVVVLDVRPAPAAGRGATRDATRGRLDAAAADAAGLGLAVLADGGRLILATCESRGPVVATVDEGRTLSRRLARAVAGEPADPPEGWPVEVVSA